MPFLGPWCVNMKRNRTPFMTSISAVNPLVFVEKESSFDRGLCTNRFWQSLEQAPQPHCKSWEDYIFKKTCFLRRFFLICTWQDVPLYFCGFCGDNSCILNSVRNYAWILSRLVLRKITKNQKPRQHFLPLLQHMFYSNRKNLI